MSEDNRDLKEDLSHDGYSLEEKYFYELNRELIRKIQAEIGQRSQTMGGSEPSPRLRANQADDPDEKKGNHSKLAP